MKPLALTATGLLLAFAVAPILVATAGEAEMRKEVRNEFKKDKKPMFFDASHFVDLAKLGDSRWSIPDPPRPGATIKEGLQMRAIWSASSGADAEPGITLYVLKLPHKERKDSNTNTVFSRTFGNLGETCLISDAKKLIEFSHGDWVAGAKEVEKKKGKKAGKKRVGPAKLFAAAQATDAKEGKRQRREWYMWGGNNVTWEIRIIYSAAVLNNKAVIEKGMAFVKAIKESPKPALKRISKAGKK